MAFKINTKKRAQIHSDLIFKIKDLFPNGYSLLHSEFMNAFYKETGLLKTSVRYVYGVGDIILYYFKITDVRKYMLAKIKYGL